jgi:hypothetical protein
MRTSFRHQSEAQPPNGPLTAATSPDTPSTCPATQSVSRKCAGSTFPPPLPLLPGLLALLLKYAYAQTGKNSVAPANIFFKRDWL